MTAATEHVLIIGTGLSGLALANVLKNNGIPYKVFERDPSPENRTQGWSLSMHYCNLKLFTKATALNPAKLIGGTPEGSNAIGLRIRERSPAFVFGAPSKKAGAVTLIGDTAHSMTMFRREGGNHAIVDACILGEHLIDAYSPKFTINKALTKFQSTILPRVIATVQESHAASSVMHGSCKGVNQMIASIFKRQDS